ncbi:hypothetical protein ILYODFUR_005331 [Ilyodon furcidens]|uniref:Uncharacterized protein n=1 Tax=Ilyodon furcidens TaxID=33524 RepID=A0ABV0TSE2_9TELE
MEHSASGPCQVTTIRRCTTRWRDSTQSPRAGAGTVQFRHCWLADSLIQFSASSINLAFNRPEFISRLGPDCDPLFEVVWVQTDSGAVRFWSKYESASICLNYHKRTPF